MAEKNWAFETPALQLNGVMYRIRECGDTLDKAVEQVAKVSELTIYQKWQLRKDADAMLKLAGEKGARDAGVVK